MRARLEFQHFDMAMPAAAAVAAVKVAGIYACAIIVCTRDRNRLVISPLFSRSFALRSLFLESFPLLNERIANCEL